MSEKEYMTQREVFAECDRLVAIRNQHIRFADMYVYDIKTIERTLILFEGYYRLTLSNSQEKELLRLIESLSYQALSLYWFAEVNHKKFEDLWNANKPFVFS